MSKRFPITFITGNKKKLEEFLQIIQSSAEATAAELIISLPGNLTAAERRSAVEDFALARAHLTF